METDYQKAVEDNKDTVYKIAYAGCGNTADAEDIFQEVFMKLLVCRKNFSSEEHLKNWLIRVTVNQVKMLRRKAKFRKTHTAENIEISTGGNVGELAENMLIRSAVMELPDNYRMIVLLYYYGDRTVKEIANIVGSKEQTVKTRLHRARLILKEKLKEDWCDE